MFSKTTFIAATAFALTSSAKPYSPEAAAADATGSSGRIPIPGNDNFFPEMKTWINPLNCDNKDTEAPGKDDLIRLQKALADEGSNDATYAAAGGTCTILRVSDGKTDTSGDTQVVPQDSKARISICVPDPKAKPYMPKNGDLANALQYLIDHCPGDNIGGTAPFNPWNDGKNHDDFIYIDRKGNSLPY